MRAVVQRVKSAQVTIEREVIGSIETGLCVFVGVGQDDTDVDAKTLAEKVVMLRVFEDAAGRMNAALLEQGGQLLAVSQFTLFGDLRRGRRPSFGEAMEPEGASRLYALFCKEVRARGVVVAEGRFKAHMEVSLVNDGPVTILIDTKKAF